MRRILLILPYIGNLNAGGYFRLFLQSCRANSTIDFLLLTDDRTEYAYPPNLHVIRTTLGEMKERFQKHFDFSISLESPYKLCDYKLAYGELFRQEIEGYDAWGFCDLDVVFGNLRAFLTEERLDRFGRIYTRGHLSVFRADVPRDFYRQPLPYRPSYQDVFSNPGSYSFDEWVNQDACWDPVAKVGYDSCFAIDNFDVTPPNRNNPVSFRQAESSRDPELTIYEKRVQKNVIFYDNGKLFRIGLLDGRKIFRDELAYAHFQKRRLKMKTNDLSGQIAIVPNAVRRMRQIPASKMDLYWLNADITRWQYILERSKQKWNARFGGKYEAKGLAHPAGDPQLSDPDF